VIGRRFSRAEGGIRDVATAHRLSAAAVEYCDEKVANREIRVWHFVIEKGY
jgi:hypothetical protein